MALTLPKQIIENLNEDPHVAMNSPIVANGFFGLNNTFLLNGTNQWIDLSTRNPFISTASTKMTIGLWIKGPFTGENEGIMMSQISSSNIGWKLSFTGSIGGNGLEVKFYTNSGNNISSIVSPEHLSWDDNNYHFIIGRLDNNVLDIAIGGILATNYILKDSIVGGGFLGWSTDPPNLTIGSDSTGAFLQKGTFHLPMFWEEMALSNQEIFDWQGKVSLNTLDIPDHDKFITDITGSNYVPFGSPVLADCTPFKNNSYILDGTDDFIEAIFKLFKNNSGAIHAIVFDWITPLTFNDGQIISQNDFGSGGSTDKGFSLGASFLDRLNAQAHTGTSTANGVQSLIDKGVDDWNLGTTRFFLIFRQNVTEVYFNGLESSSYFSKNNIFGSGFTGFANMPNLTIGANRGGQFKQGGIICNVKSYPGINPTRQQIFDEFLLSAGGQIPVNFPKSLKEPIVTGFKLAHKERNTSMNTEAGYERLRTVGEGDVEKFVCTLRYSELDDILAFDDFLKYTINYGQDWFLAGWFTCWGYTAATLAFRFVKIQESQEGHKRSYKCTMEMQPIADAPQPSVVWPTTDPTVGYAFERFGCVSPSNDVLSSVDSTHLTLKEGKVFDGRWVVDWVFVLYDLVTGVELSGPHTIDVIAGDQITFSPAASPIPAVGQGIRFAEYDDVDDSQKIYAFITDGVLDFGDGGLAYKISFG